MTAEEIAAGLDLHSVAIFALVPPSEPEPACWLNEDSDDLCWECAVKERGKQFDLGVPLTPHRWRRTELEAAFYEGIDGGYHGQMPSDTTEWCECCNKKLAYTLTDYGLSEEVEHWLLCELSGFGPDDAYDLDRLIIAAYPEGGDEHLRVAQGVLTICQQVRSILEGNPHADRA